MGVVQQETKKEEIKVSGEVPEGGKYGFATAGFGTPEEHQIPISEYMSMKDKEGRLVSIAELSDGSYIVQVENPEGSERTPHMSMRLSKQGLYTLSRMLMSFSILAEETEMFVVDKDCDMNMSDRLIETLKKHQGETGAISG